MKKNKKIVLNKDSIEAVEKLIACTEDSLIFVPGSDIRFLLYKANKITLLTAVIKKATEDEIIASGLISPELKEAKSCIISITAGLSLSLTDVDTISRVIQENTSAEKVMLASHVKEAFTKKDVLSEEIKIDLFLLE